MMNPRSIHGFLLISLTILSHAFVGPAQTRALEGNPDLASYFTRETERLADRCLAEVNSKDDWPELKRRYREQLFEMMGLSPRPPRTDLQAVVTGGAEEESFRVENLHFQSMPGFYVTANLYLPKEIERPVPVILYLCGHGGVKIDGVSYGSKVHYQHHGAWFARNGYACLILDTVQLGEIEGLHHGTYREGMWWWNARGYTPAGAEAWNCIRALDYLETRPAIDMARVGVTGRSGGGAYSWWVAALDDRVKAVAPVAGITDLENHVVDGVVEGHCDCMFVVNTHRWDYAQVAALVAPRPLLIVNTDSDNIFPLDGVVRVFEQVRRVYEVLGAPEQVGLAIGPGPHKDTQNIRVPVFHWFNQHLKGESAPVEMAAVPFFEPAQLKVFDELPADERTSRIHETFVAVAETPSVPGNADEWTERKQVWMDALRDKVFAGWPGEKEAGYGERLRKGNRGGHQIQLQTWSLESQPDAPVKLYVMQSVRHTPKRIVLTVLNDERGESEPSGRGGVESNRTGEKASAGDWNTGPSYERLLSLVLPDLQPGSDEKRPRADVIPDRDAYDAMKDEIADGDTMHMFLAVRGVGPLAWEGDARDQIQIRRRFMLVGQTLDGMRVWDVRRAIQAIRRVRDLRELPLTIRARGDMACHALYASLFESDLAGLELWDVPGTHMKGPDYLNVLRFLDIPQALAMAAERTPVILHGAVESDWKFATQTAKTLEWDNALRFSP